MTEERIVWISMREAADYVGMSYGRFAEKVRNGEIPANKVPGFTRAKRINKAKLDKMMEASETNAVNN